MKNAALEGFLFGAMVFLGIVPFSLWGVATALTFRVWYFIPYALVLVALHIIVYKVKELVRKGRLKEEI